MSDHQEMDGFYADAQEPCVGQWNDLLVCISDRVAFECGDTFIEYRLMSPYAQWQRITKMLDKEGFAIVRKS